MQWSFFKPQFHAFYTTHILLFWKERIEFPIVFFQNQGAFYCFLSHTAVTETSNFCSTPHLQNYILKDYTLFFEKKIWKDFSFFHWELWKSNCRKSSGTNFSFLWNQCLKSLKSRESKNQGPFIKICTKYVCIV